MWLGCHYQVSYEIKKVVWMMVVVMIDWSWNVVFVLILYLPIHRSNVDRTMMIHDMNCFHLLDEISVIVKWFHDYWYDNTTIKRGKHYNQHTFVVVELIYTIVYIVVDSCLIRWRRSYLKIFVKSKYLNLQFGGSAYFLVLPTTLK